MLKQALLYLKVRRSGSLTAHILFRFDTRCSGAISLTPCFCPYQELNHDHCVVVQTLHLLRYPNYLIYFYIRMEFKAIALMLGRLFYITLSLSLSLSLSLYIYIYKIVPLNPSVPLSGQIITFIPPSLAHSLTSLTNILIHLLSSILSLSLYIYI